MTISTPVKIVALAALAIALGLGGLLLVTQNGNAGSPGTPAPVAQQHVAVAAAHAAVKTAPHKTVVHKAVVHKTAVKLLPNLPAIVRRALAHKPAAVVLIYSSHSAFDRSILAEARAGASAAHVGFVAANVAVEPIARAVATWSPSVMDPAVLIVRRPGKIVFTVSGPTDRDTVAQAATSAR